MNSVDKATDNRVYLATHHITDVLKQSCDTQTFLGTWNNTYSPVQTATENSSRTSIREAVQQALIVNR
jgi:hypothetical protein